MDIKNNKVLQRPIFLRRLFLIMFFVLPHSVSGAINDEVETRDLFARAVTLTAEGEWLAAEKLFKQISLMHPESPEAKNNLAVSLLKQGKVEQAKLAIEEAVTSLPGFKVAQNNRKKLYDHAASVAYHKATGNLNTPDLPTLELLPEIYIDLKKDDADMDDIALASLNLKSDEVIASNIENLVVSWSKAWSDLQIEQYLSFYSLHFKPLKPLEDYTQWRDIRRAKFRFSGPLRITTQLHKVYLHTNEKQALVEFLQSYQSNKYQDKVLKQLHLVLENDRWLIRSENVLQQLN